MFNIPASDVRPGEMNQFRLVLSEGTVGRVDFREYGRDVLPRNGLGDPELLGDVGVGEAPRNGQQYVLLPFREFRNGGWYRFMVQIRSDTSKNISSAWRWITKVRPAPKDVRIAIDIDALNMM